MATDDEAERATSEQLHDAAVFWATAREELLLRPVDGDDAALARLDHYARRVTAQRTKRGDNYTLDHKLVQIQDGALDAIRENRINLLGGFRAPD
ncbi:hypothetical protein [Rhodococcus sp. P1Y]|uniref:hypothetical protein n=1 Tax=Rhodococcus sp. P1Y TaxID=1302308 RepID=UPI000EACAAB3|nr:hypothetical protein [Rhodococcus sp. P1Y]AYJ48999.1 hypothetical protein D8W71_12360 [Rhodococcus sp. P1Y]